ncbi:MAG: helix-turn-helix domain-containing protein [Clostridia bacterium]|nr:helix-turn-helix domain-containing protein [Clostridia bacterium]
MGYVRAVTHTDLHTRIPTHRHTNVHQLIYVRRGAVTLKVAEEEIPVLSPSVLFVSNLETHALLSTDTPFERYTVSIDPQLAPSGLQDARLLSVFTDRPESFAHVLPVPAVADRLDVLFALLYEEFERTPEDAGFDGMCDALFKTVLAVLWRTSPEAFPCGEVGATDLVGQIKADLSANLSEPLKISDLAYRHHLSPCYLSHLFKASTGYSMKRYRMLCRVAEARALLSDSKLSVTEICGRVGFEDMSNFARYFKAEVGVTPSAYRAANRSES